jgi:hypothetical protein
VHGLEWQSSARPHSAFQGAARFGRQGLVWSRTQGFGSVELGPVWQVWWGRAVLGSALRADGWVALGWAGKVLFGIVRRRHVSLGSAGFGRQG